jgi:hypothetical protein
LFVSAIAGVLGIAAGFLVMRDNAAADEAEQAPIGAGTPV